MTFLQDIASALGPDKRLGVGIVVSDVFVNGVGQFWHAGEDTTPQTLGGDITEETLDHVQPGSGCLCEVHDKSRMFLHGMRQLGTRQVGHQAPDFFLTDHSD